ncbi:MAG: type IV pilus modification PilV family protein [Desulfovibrionales bacterium]
MKQAQLHSRSLPGQGFTLIEVLVAVSLMAIALVAVLKTSMQNQDALIASERSTTAALLASEKMARLQSSPSEIRDDQGRFEDPFSLFTWEVRSKPSLNTGMQLVEVQVDYQGNPGRPVLFQAYSMRKQ